MNETPLPAPKKPDHVVAITAIVAITLILLACIAGSVGALIVLFQNLPH